MDTRKIVRGALLSAMDAHGNINRQNVDSAAKRVTGALRGAWKDESKRRKAVRTALVDSGNRRD